MKSALARKKACRGWALTVGVGEWVVGWQAGGIYNVTTTSLYFNISPTALTGLAASAADTTYAQREYRN